MCWKGVCRMSPNFVIRITEQGPGIRGQYALRMNHYQREMFRRGGRCLMITVDRAKSSDLRLHLIVFPLVLALAACCVRSLIGSIVPRCLRILPGSSWKSGRAEAEDSLQCPNWWQLRNCIHRNISASGTSRYSKAGMLLVPQLWSTLQTARPSGVSPVAHLLPSSVATRGMFGRVWSPLEFPTKCRPARHDRIQKD